MLVQQAKEEELIQLRMNFRFCKMSSIKINLFLISQMFLEEHFILKILLLKFLGPILLKMQL